MFEFWVGLSTYPEIDEYGGEYWESDFKFYNDESHDCETGSKCEELIVDGQIKLCLTPQDVADTWAIQNEFLKKFSLQLGDACDFDVHTSLYQSAPASWKDRKTAISAIPTTVKYCKFQKKMSFATRTPKPVSASTRRFEVMGTSVFWSLWPSVRPQQR
jgi:hypothetical protein